MTLKSVAFETKHCVICSEQEKPGYGISRNKYNTQICDRCEIKAARYFNK